MSRNEVRAFQGRGGNGSAPSIACFPCRCNFGSLGLRRGWHKMKSGEDFDSPESGEPPTDPQQHHLPASPGDSVAVTQRRVKPRPASLTRSAAGASALDPMRMGPGPGSPPRYTQADMPVTRHSVWHTKDAHTARQPGGLSGDAVAASAPHPLPFVSSPACPLPSPSLLLPWDHTSQEA